MMKRILFLLFVLVAFPIKAQWAIMSTGVFTGDTLSIVSESGTKTDTIKLYNNTGLVFVVDSVSGLSAPFSTSFTSGNLVDTLDIPIVFDTASAGTYTDYLVVYASGAVNNIDSFKVTGNSTLSVWYAYYDSLVASVNTANNPTITVQGTLGDSMYVDWGDGNNDTYVFTSSSQDISHVYTSVVDTVIKFYGNLTTFNTSSNMDWTFNISQLNNFSGMQYFKIGGTNHLTGNFSSIVGMTNLVMFKVYDGTNKIGDDLGDLSALSSLTQFKLADSNTVADYSVTTWTQTGMSYFDLEGTASLSTAEVDQLIIDLDADISFAGTLIITGNCEPRSSASNTAVNNIISRGGTVTTNTITSSSGDYYVDATAGNDTYNGTSTSTPWKTLSKVSAEITAGTIAPGDTILFKRGEVWNEPFTIDNLNGTLGDSIVFSAYGTGAKPEITCEADLPGWDVSTNWTNTSGNIWRITYTALNDKVRRLWIDGTEEGMCWWRDSLTIYETGVTVAFADAPGTSGWTNVPNATFKWKGGDWDDQLEVYSTSNPASAYSSMLYYTGRSNIIQVTNSSYLIFENIKTTGGSYASLIFYGGHDIEVKNMDLCDRASGSGVIVRTSSGIDPYNFKIHDNVIDTRYTRYDPYRYGNTQFGVEFDYGAYDCEVYNDSITGIVEAAFRVLASSTISATPPHDITFRDNYIDGSGQRYAVGANMHAVGSGSPAQDPTPYNIYIYRNKFHWTTKHFQMGIRDSYIMFNIFDNNWGKTDSSRVVHHVDATGFGNWETVDDLSIPGDFLSEGESTGKNTYYFNNTHFNIGNYSIYQDSNYDSCFIANNLLVNSAREYSSTTPNNWRWPIYIRDTGNGHIIKNNWIAPLSQTSYSDEYVSYGKTNYGYPGYIMTVTQFNAKGGVDGDVISGNYLSSEAISALMDTTNFTIPSGSSAKNAGTDISSYMTGFTGFTDINGNTVNTTTPNVGAIDN